MHTSLLKTRAHTHIEYSAFEQCGGELGNLPYSEVIGTSGNNIRVMGTCSDSSDSLSMTHQYMERNTQLTNVP